LVQEDAAVVGRKKICELYRKVSRNFVPIGVMEGGRKDRNELSQWQLRIPSEVNGLSAPFCSLNWRTLPQCPYITDTFSSSHSSEENIFKKQREREKERERE
jgi:hypothetical protein